MAVSGATSENLQMELDKLNEWSKKNLKQEYPDTRFANYQSVFSYSQESTGGLVRTPMANFIKI